VAVARRETRPAALALVALEATYYIGFIDVILYVYDRFLLPVAVIQAMLGGVALDRFLGERRRPSWRVAAVSAIFVYTVLYAGTVDLLMLRDSRYAAERWLRDHARADDAIGIALPMVVLPRLNDLRYQDVGNVEELGREAPRLYVVNADYARAIPVDSPGGRLIEGLQRGTLGYSLAFRYRTPAPWPWLPAAHPDLVGPRLKIPYSFLSDINPETEIYERDEPARR
jgi:hypothetical protein